MMFTNDERREVAKKLREQAKNNYFTLMQWWDNLQLAVMGKVYITAPEKVYLSIADLIDCPTCRLELTEIETHGNAKVKIYECSECGRTCEEIYDKYERCPHCGAVVEDAER